jgi:TolA-binding protein
MATISAPASWTPRQLWQVPVFLLGLGSLAVLLFTRPLWHTPAAVARHRLERARHLLQDPNADTDRIIALAQAYLDQAGPDAERAGEAHFLIGSAWVRVARAASRDAASAWRAAREALEQAEQRRVAAEDEPLLRFRLGLCGFHTGADPRRVAALLAETVETSDDKVEGYRALALAYLAQPKPDLVGALRANEALRQLPLLGEDVLGPARLQAGELLLELRRPEEARRVLRTVSTAAAPAVLARARTLLARTHQAEGGWAEAAALWQEILEDKRQPLKHPGPVLYQLGLCYRRLEQLPDAARAWSECVKRGDGDAAGAAALGLAEVLLAEGKPDALASFERAVRDVRRPQDWKNELVRLPQAQTVFESGVGVCRQRGDFEAALRLATLYERLAEPGRAALLRGQVAEGWAQILREQPPPGGAPTRATQLFREAGDAYLLSAEQATTKAVRAERLWLSAGGYLRAQDAERAMPVLRKFLALGERPDFAGEAWFLLAETERRLRHEPAAEEAYRACLRYPGRFASRSRFQLSQIQLRRGRTDRAVEILEQNIRLLRREEPDDEALEQSLFAYGALLFRRRDYQGYQQAQVHLEEAVAKFPQSQSAVRGRYQLAEACRLLAAEESRLATNTLDKRTREHRLKQQRLLLRQAVEQYTALKPYTDGRAGGPLSAAEQTHVLFSTAECRFNLGEYTTALVLYDGLAERYKDRPERLVALGGSARCYGASKDFIKLQERLQEIRVALPTLDTASRRRWEVWLKDAARQP